MLRKGLAVAVILLFMGTCIIPSATSGLTNGKNIITVDDEPGESELTHNKNIITVDDEPGDADFTSIKEAVNYSSPGDTINSRSYSARIINNLSISFPSGVLVLIF